MASTGVTKNVAKSKRCQRRAAPQGRGLSECTLEKLAVNISFSNTIQCLRLHEGCGAQDELSSRATLQMSWEGSLPEDGSHGWRAGAQGSCRLLCPGTHSSTGRTDTRALSLTCHHPAPAWTTQSAAFSKLATKVRAGCQEQQDRPATGGNKACSVLASPLRDRHLPTMMATHTAPRTEVRS